MSKIEEIKINELHPFEENPFKACSETEQEELIQSIREFGIITPMIVRKMRTDMKSFPVTEDTKRQKNSVLKPYRLM